MALYNIVDSNVMPIKSCSETLGYSQPSTQVNPFIPLTTLVTSIPTFTSNIMATSTQTVIPTTIGHRGNPSSSFNPPSLPMSSISVHTIPQPINVTQGGNSFNNFVPPLSAPFPTQSSPMPTYHNVTPPYSQSVPSFNNITPPSQLTMSNIHSSTEMTINNLVQTVSSLQQQIASISQSKFSVPTFDVGSSLFLDIFKSMPTKHIEIPQLELYNGKGDPLTHVKTFQTFCTNFSYDQ